MLGTGWSKWCRVTVSALVKLVGGKNCSHRLLGTGWSKLKSRSCDDAGGNYGGDRLLDTG